MLLCTVFPSISRPTCGKGLARPIGQCPAALVSVEMSATFHLYCLFCCHSHGSSHLDSCLRRRNHLCLLGNGSQIRDQSSVGLGCGVCLPCRGGNSVWLCAVTMLSRGATGSWKTGWRRDCVTGQMVRTLPDPSVERWTSHHMTPVSRHCSSLLVSGNFLEKRRTSELSVMLESCCP